MKIDFRAHLLQQAGREVWSFARAKCLRRISGAAALMSFADSDSWEIMRRPACCCTGGFFAWEFGSRCTAARGHRLHARYLFARFVLATAMPPVDRGTR